MSVYQRSDGRWVVKVKDTSRRPAKWVQRTFRTKEDADAFQDEATQEERQCSRLTVYEAVGLYLKDRSLCEKCKNQYRWLVGGARPDQTRAKQKVGYAECIAERFVDSLDRRDLNTVRDCCREGGCSNRTVNAWTDRLESVFNYCVQEDLIPRNPWANYKPLEAERGSHSGTLEQLRAVYPYLPAWLQWAAKTALALFLRPGIVELFRLQWSAFRWQTGSVTVYMGKVGTSKTVYPVKEYLAEAWERFCADGQDASLYVCRSTRGLPVHHYAHPWLNAFKKAGLKPFPLYGLRHIAATTALEQGADVAAVAANLGHASPVTTLRSYAHALPQAQRAASASLGAVWCGMELPEPEKTGG